MTNTKHDYCSPSLLARAFRHKFWPLSLILSGVIMLCMTAHYARPHKQLIQAQAVPRTAAASTAKPMPAARDRAIAALPTKLQAIFVQYPDVDFSVSVVDMSSGKTVHMGDKVAFDAASTTKLITAVDYLHTAETHEHALDDDLSGDSAQDWLEKLIVDSDETAWQVLNEVLTHEQMESYAGHIGLKSYDPDQNTDTSDDIALLLQKLYNGELLNSSHTSLLLSFMQQANYRDYIVAAAPKNATVYHKAGRNDNVAHDAAIVANGSHSFVLVIYSSIAQAGDGSAQTQALQAITSTVGAAFN